MINRNEFDNLVFQFQKLNNEMEFLKTEVRIYRELFKKIGLKKSDVNWALELVAFREELRQQDDGKSILSKEEFEELSRMHLIKRKIKFLAENNKFDEMIQIIAKEVLNKDS